VHRYDRRATLWRNTENSRRRYVTVPVVGACEIVTGHFEGDMNWTLQNQSLHEYTSREEMREFHRLARAILGADVSGTGGALERLP
jgi:hypothetical protein